ncbi:DUF4397 domain-containing protein [Bacillus salitolerans]|uniref:DUF4397 domain-containing protein n=1 Tax=Bacillus salitolerans TaxID=1437434 RepID=A0ABW4LSF0_9BACI
MYPYMQNQADYYLQQAAKYDLLAMYYKYSDPNRHIYYYKCHLQAMNQALTCMQTQHGYRAEGAGNPNAKVRILHTSPNAPAVDIYVNGGRVVQNVAFKQVSRYLDVPGGSHTLEIYPTGQKNNPVLRESITLMPGVYYTAAATGPLNELELLALVDKPFVEYGQAKVRFVHLSPDVKAVDVATKRGNVLFSGVSFGEASTYQNVTPGKVDLQVLVTGTSDVALSVPTANIRPNTAYTVYALGLATGTPALEALVLQDS